MDNTLPITNIQLFVDLYKFNNKMIQDYQNKFQELDTSEISNVDKVSGMRDMLNEKKKMLLEIKKQVDKLAPALMTGQSYELSANIDKLIESIDSVVDNLDVILSNLNNDIREELTTNIEKYNTLDDSLSGLINITSFQFYRNITNELNNKTISIEEVQNLLNEPGLMQDQKDIINNAIQDYKTAERNNNTEQSAIENNEGSLNTDAAVSDTLNDRLNGIVLDSNVGYSTQVNETRTNFEIEQIQKDIDALLEKQTNEGRLSVVDTIKLSTLLDHKSRLEESLVNTNVSKKDQRRDDKIANLESKLNARRDDITQLRDRRNGMNSRLFKYASARKEQRLMEKIQKLQQKQGSVMEEQRALSTVAFDKKNKKMFRKAAIGATFNLVKDETKNVVSDIKRFVHNSELFQKLKGKAIQLVSTPAVLTPDESVEEISMSR